MWVEMEDIEHYLAEKEKRFEGKTKLFRDLRVFDFNFIPARPLMRDELKAVIDGLLRYEKTGIANHLILIGSRGSGKTLSVRYLQRLFRDRGLTMLYGNCRVTNSSYRLLADFLRVRARGVSFSELAQQFCDAYPEKTVVVLDEVDLLSDKDRHKDILYFLSRAENNYMTILLSNSPKWSTSIDLATQSSLQAELIYFRPYTAGELSRILEERARAGLHNAPDAVLAKIAAMTAKYTNSDVRVAIKTLYYWALDPHIVLDENFQKARKDVVAEVVRNLNDKNLMILKAAVGEERTAKQVYGDYRRLCRQFNEEPFSYVYFYSTLAYLQSLGLIVLVSTKVRRTYTKLIQITFPPELLDMIWKVRFQ